ncbi:hypothetical protein ABZY36_38115 [Streptomyces sp. NPDC006627]|uniref:hypothetical protein n=1 Tax=Streptomyces sp. NPDC006627 TaxID=3154679 RepID=UPI0033BA6707
MVEPLHNSVAADPARVPVREPVVRAVRSSDERNHHLSYTFNALRFARANGPAFPG